MCPCYFNERQCNSARFGDYCDTVCCDWGTQERCHEPSLDDPGMSNVFCANIADGGCPCPDGETRCGTMETDGGFTGACMAICCDGDNEQVCYDENYDPSYCALIDEGGCPCPEGKVRCGGTHDWAGYCTNVCCDDVEEETCFDDQGRISCSRILLGCSSKTSYEFWKSSSRLSSTILAKGTGSQVSYYSNIMDRKKKLLASSEEKVRMIKKLEAEEAALFHAIRMRERGSSVKIEEIDRKSVV